MGQHIVFAFLRFCTFFKIFHVRLGKKTKNVSRGVYVCVKAKQTFVSFFQFFFAPFPKEDKIDASPSSNFGHSKTKSCDGSRSVVVSAHICPSLGNQ